jgi:protein-S-isoprenylcysteine O-methyltransferase Ste14
MTAGPGGAAVHRHTGGLEMKEKLLLQAKHEFSPGQRIMGLAVEGVVFLGILPTGLVYFSALLDRQLGMPRFGMGPVNVVIGAALLVGGFALGFWSVYVQFTVGRGTPVPVMATQQLIVQKPYSYCRNPMALGAIVAYLGVAVIVASAAAVLLVAAGTALLLTYIKVLEEKEMEARFGEAYEQYRKETPFIFPRFGRRNAHKP